MGALQSAKSALGGVDESIVILPPSTANNPRRRREIALQNVRNWSSLEHQIPGLPIRTSIDLEAMGFPPNSSERTQQRLRQAARQSAQEEFREPYIPIRAGLVEGYLPMIKANLVLQGIDGPPSDPICQLNSVEMIWDSGAHHTIITEDILSREFQAYLNSPVHDPYRSIGGSRVWLEVSIALTNAPVSISGIAVVVPRSVVPNKRIGILFGQSQCIDRLSYRSIPRRLLQARDRDIVDNLWGDIVIEEYLDEDDRIVSFSGSDFSSGI